MWVRITEIGTTSSLYTRRYLLIGECVQLVRAVQRDSWYQGQFYLNGREVNCLQFRYSREGIERALDGILK